MAKGLKPLADTSGAKAQNIEYLASDIEVNGTASLRINLSGTAVDVEITRDGGATWVTLITALTVNFDTTVITGIRSGDQINFRTINASGITLDYFRVDQSDTEI